MNDDQRDAYEQAYDEMISMGSTDEETTSYLDWKFGINQGK